MKIATDLEQSRKLAEILSIESADMFYDVNRDGIRCTPEILVGKLWSKDIPAWSFTKLCELMEVEYKIEKTYLDQSNICTYSFIFEGLPDGQPGYYRTYEREEMIDAAVEFIEFLKRNELL